MSDQSCPETSTFDTEICPCYGRKPHLWGPPTDSRFWGCTVKSCARCGAVVRVSTKAAS